MTSFGGQAVIEGIMMRSKHYMSVAVRLDNGKIKTKHEKLKQSFWSKILFIRGIYNLYDMSKMGLKALNWSADQQLKEEDDEENKILNVILILITTTLSIIFALLLFKAGPFFLSRFLVGNEHLILFNVLDGSIKLLLLILYILVLSLFKETRKIFEYHGAEHKTIGCLEAKKELTVNNCRIYAKEHKRCGTNFLFFVIFVSILVYLFIPLSMAWYYNLALRVAFLPLIAGISYEVLRFNDKYQNGLTNLFSVPGILMQKLTTKSPNDKQLEVGIKALEIVVNLEKKYK